MDQFDQDVLDVLTHHNHIVIRWKKKSETVWEKDWTSDRMTYDTAYKLFSKLRPKTGESYEITAFNNPECMQGSMNVGDLESL